MVSRGPAVAAVVLGCVALVAGVVNGDVRAIAVGAGVIAVLGLFLRLTAPSG